MENHQITPAAPRVEDPMQKPPEITVSGEDLRQTEREDTVAPLQPLLKEGPTKKLMRVFRVHAAIAAVRTLNTSLTFL